MATLSNSELQILNEFRKSVNDILQPNHDDAFLLRWLRARNFKLDDAEDMLRKNMIWRERFKVDSILKSFRVPEVLKLYAPIGFLTYDKEGCPVWLFRFGYTDVKGIIYSAKKSDIITFFIFLLEKSTSLMEEQSKMLGKPIECHTIICDLDNFALQQLLWKPAFDIAVSMITCYEANFPERIKSIFIINAPAVFSIAFALMKPFLSEATYKKIRISGRDGWEKAILSEIEADGIPLHWGGTKTGPNEDPFCTNLVPPGGMVPESFYGQNNQMILNEEDVQILEIGLKSVYNFEVYVEECESVLQWEFKTEKCDIAFGVFYRQDEYNVNDLIEVVPMEKVNCHLLPETGAIVCENEGTYVLKFDNSSSYFRSKTVRLRTEVIPPVTKL